MAVSREAMHPQTEHSRRRWSTMLELEIEARGVAQAMVFLTAAPDPGRMAMAMDDDLSDLESCFVKDERTISAALGAHVGLAAAAAPAARSRGGRRSAYATARGRTYAQTAPMRHFEALGIVLGDVHADGFDKLIAHPRVRYVGSSLQVSLIRPLESSSAKLSATTTWGIERLGAPKLWAAGFTGQGIRVGHLDTGVDGEHPALRSAVKGFLLTDADGFEVPRARPQDTGSHGTHTAGTIGGRGVNGKFIGVAPGAELYCAAVIEDGNVVARILAGLNWAAQQGVKIVSLSLGLRGYEDSFLELITALRTRGILPIVAVGNEGPGTSRSPGNYPNVLSVGAMSEDTQVPDFSSSESFATPNNRIVPDLVAPGVGVVSAKAGGGYAQSRGTSMAAPHIAGLAAVLWSAKPNASAEEVEAAIQGSCSLQGMPRDRANLGLPNAVEAYRRLTGSALPVGSTAPSPAHHRAKRRAAKASPRRAAAPKKSSKKKKKKRTARK